MKILNLERLKQLDKGKLQRIKIGTVAVLLTFNVMSLSGCYNKIEQPVQEEYDTINVVDMGNDGLKGTGLVQELEIPGESFKLITTYSCDSTSKRSWKITSDKFLYLDVYTKDLPEDTNIYIDNIHIDTSILSSNEEVNGILQDTMDDRVHNAMMYGFPVGNDIHYFGVNAIEGSNQEFIQGTMYGFSSYSHGSVETKRFTEEDYINMGVVGNKFQIVYDLLIQGPNDKTPRNVSVATDFVVSIAPLTKEEQSSQKVLTK